MLSFTLLAGLVYSQNDPACISLANSRACPEFRGKYLLTLDYSILGLQNSFSSAAAFDTYVQSKSGWNYNDLCPQFRNAAQSQIRYANTFICGFAVYASSQGLQGRRCNVGIPQPPRVCRTSLNAAIQDVDAILKSSCPSQGIFAQYTSYASNQTDRNCILAVGSEIPLKCGMKLLILGFPTSAQADTFCRSNPNAICCTSPSNTIEDPLPASVSVPDVPVTGNVTTGSNSTIQGPDTNGTDIQTTEISPPIATDGAANSSSSPGGVNPLLIGAGALGVALIAVLASVLFFMSKKSKAAKNNDSFLAGKVETPRQSISPEEDTMECVFEYKANLFDELSLKVGDEVQVLNRYDDGWAMGYNMSTQKEGTFPLACLAPFGAVSEYGRDSQYSKRGSSMFAESNYGDMRR